MGIVRSQHLGDNLQAAAGDILLYTAGDVGVTVVKGLSLGVQSYGSDETSSGAILCQFSGGSYVPLLTGFSEGSGQSDSITCWVVMPPGSQLFLRGDGIGIWAGSADGAVLQDT